MPPAAPIEPNKKKKTSPESSLSSSCQFSPERADFDHKRRRFSHLRGVQWRIDLGILPSSSSSIDEIRRVTADCRRSYAALRRRLLISPPMSKDERNFSNLVMDNPLSQNPDSMWGQFFHKAELERMVDQDLSRLYPEHGSYFQAPECQGVLRRILLLWCIRHPNYGYRQGMHELLAPLLYVLKADLARLSEVRKLYQDYFTDNFDGLSFNITDLSYNSDLENGEDIHNQAKVTHFNDLDPKIQTIISFSDAYGAEGELGIVLSYKFIEHDAYSMFDALMNGDDGAVAVASFYSYPPSHENGLPPVIEASSSLYRLLSTVDFSLYSHLVELGVEPQYFALRWLRVLFGREFALEDLLVIWDEIFAVDNSKLKCGGSKKKSEVKLRAFSSLRGAFISALAVSMILYLRSSLLATENATSCLQRLLNFPEDVNLGKLIKKAKSLMNLAIDVINSFLEPVLRGGPCGPSKSRGHRHSHSLSSDLTAKASPRGLVPESYWEEKWRDMNKEDEDQKEVGISKQVQNRIMGWSEKVKMRLAKVTRSHVRSYSVDGSANLHKSSSESNDNNDHGNEPGSSVASSSSVIRNEPGSGPNRSPSPSPNIASALYRSTEDVFSPLPISDNPEDSSFKEVKNEDISKKAVSDSLDGTSSGGMFPWLWMSAKVGPADSLDKSEGPTSSAAAAAINQKNAVADDVDHNDLKNLAKSMLENIEVIESVENLSENAVEALKELRKIRGLISEM